jgi:hypothetical protein
MKNFYHILEIEADASGQTIKQAYKKLARQYHPDLLSSEKREDPSSLEKFQEINEAYQVLSDNKKRKEYDLAFKEYEQKLSDAASPFERRSLLVKCARTKRTYKMLLARRKNTTGKFEITGFEAQEKPLLTDGSSNWFSKITGAFLAKPREILLKPKISDYSSQTKFYVENPIGIQDIAWRKVIHCPDCEAKPDLLDASTTGWYVCGVCRQLFYSNDFITTITKERIFWCPWCGTKNKITPGSHSQKWRIRGQDSSEHQGNGQNRLSIEKPKALGDGKEKP